MDILHSTRAASDNGNWEHLGQLSSFAFNAALVACAKVRDYGYFQMTGSVTHDTRPNQTRVTAYVCTCTVP